MIFGRQQQRQIDNWTASIIIKVFIVCTIFQHSQPILYKEVFTVSCSYIVHLLFLSEDEDFGILLQALESGFYEL